jgi:hypothetical protein
MKRTYIATTSEAKALFDGTQTAIIVKHSNKQPYAIGQEVVVREKWMNVLDTDTLEITPEAKTGSVFENMVGAEWSSPATMPVSAARTRFIPVSCEAVRVRDVRGEIIGMGYVEWSRYIVSKLGQSAWDNNDYVFYYKIEKI